MSEDSRLAGPTSRSEDSGLAGPTSRSDTPTSARSGSYATHGSAKDRSTFPLPDIDWEPASPYWQGAVAGELRLPFCEACGSVNWYPKPACSGCGGESFDWRAVAGTGRLYSYSVVSHAFLPQYAALLPMVPALVVLDEAPSVRIVTRLVDADPAALTCDLPVEVVFRPLRFTGIDGEVVVPFFRLS